MVFELLKIEFLDLFEQCIYEKQCKQPFPLGKSRRATERLEVVHADLCGPIKMQSFDGSIYFLLFTDDFSHMSWVYFLQSKSELYSFQEI